MIRLADVEAATSKADQPKLSRYIDELCDITKDMTRTIIDRIIYRNMLYYLGEQYVEFVKSAGTFRRKALPSYIPTPVSNQIKDYIRSLKAMLLNQKLVPSVSPNSNEEEDKKAAELGGKLLTWMDTLNDSEIQDEKEKMCIWLGLAGTAFLRTYPDMDGGKWFLTRDGILKTGEVVTRQVVPFSVRYDYIGDRLQQKRWIGIQTLQAREYVEDIFKVKVESSPAPDVIDYERKLMKIVSQVSPWKGAGLETQVYQEDEDLVLLRELEFRPTKKFPQGRYVVSCHSAILVDTDRMPIKSKDGDWEYTVSDFHFDYVPGRYWSDAPVNDLVSVQNSINEIDQLLALNRKGLGRPRVISPGDISLKRINDGAHSFIILKYDGFTSKEPKIEAGLPLPTQIIEERAIHTTTFQDVSGDPKHILKGQAPSAASSGIQVDILRETAERGHYPDIERFNRSMSRVYRRRLLLASEVYTEKRQIKIAGRGNKTEIMAFKAADLRNNTDVHLELDSGIATTKAGQTQLLMQLADKGYLGPVIQDPELRDEFITRMGLAGITSQSNVDIQRAESENAAVVLGNVEGIFLVDVSAPGPDGSPEVVNDDPMFKYDDHRIHYMVHRRFILSSQFSDLPIKAKTIMFAHADIHQSLMQQEQASQAQAEAQQHVPQEQVKKLLAFPGQQTPTGNPTEPTETQITQGGM